MELIGARACCEVKQSAAGLAEFSGVVRGLQCEFFQCFHRRLRFIGDALIQAAGGILPFKNDLKCSRRCAVHTNSIPTANACTRGQLEEAERVADGSGTDGEIEWKLIELLASDCGGLCGVLSLQQSNVFGDSDRISNGTDLHGHIDSGGLTNLNAKAQLFKLSKSCNFHGQVVDTCGDGRDGEVARIRSLSFELASGGRVDGNDIGIGNNCSARVGYRACDGAPIALGQCCRRAEN